MPSHREPTFISAFAFDCTGRPLRGVIVTFTRLKDGKLTTARAVTYGQRFRPASILYRDGLEDPKVEIRATYGKLASEPEVYYADVAKPFYCEFIFHLPDGVDDDRGSDRPRKRRHGSRCRCRNTW